jgi:hypothetical protein
MQLAAISTMHKEKRYICFPDSCVEGVEGMHAFSIDPLAPDASILAACRT